MRGLARSPLLALGSTLLWGLVEFIALQRGRPGVGRTDPRH